MSFVLEMMSVRDLWKGKSVADKWFNVSEAQGTLGLEMIDLRVVILWPE